MKPRKARSVCADGSVRNEPANRSQTYLTLFNPTGFGVTATVVLQHHAWTGDAVVRREQQQRVQIDVNAELVSGQFAAFPGATDIDTGMVVTSTSPIHVSCSIFFARNVPGVGSINGVRELPVTTNASQDAEQR